jgi:hypothetical protein
MPGAGVKSHVNVMKRVYMKDRNFKSGDVQNFKSNERSIFATKRFANFRHETKWQNFF